MGSTGATAGTLESLYGDVACYEDFISIPGILASPTTFSTSTAYATIVGDRICGLGWTNFPNPVATAATIVSEFEQCCCLLIVFLLSAQVSSSHSRLGSTLMQVMSWGQRKEPLDFPFFIHRKPALKLDRTIEKEKYTILMFDERESELLTTVPRTLYSARYRERLHNERLNLNFCASAENIYQRRRQARV